MNCYNFREQIKKDHTFILTLLADSVRALCIAKAVHFESCVSLLQIWFLKQLVERKHSEQRFSLKGSDRGPSQEDVGAVLKAGKIGTCTSTIYS